MKLALAMLLTMMTGCAAITSAPKPVCVATGLASGLAAGVGVMAGALIADCGPACEQRKINGGETVHDSLNHHLAQRNDIMLVGGISAFVAFALGGYAVCQEMSDG